MGSEMCIRDRCLRFASTWRRPGRGVRVASGPQGVGVGKGADHAGSAPDFPHSPLERVVGLELDPVLAGQLKVSSMSLSTGSAALESFSASREAMTSATTSSSSTPKASLAFSAIGAKAARSLPLWITSWATIRQVLSHGFE